jgi:Putative serine esterase (DUF676)
VEGNEFTQGITQCAPVVGQWDLTATGQFTYRKAEVGNRPFGMCVSNVRLSDGIIEFEFQQPHGIIDGRVVIGYKSPQDEYLAIGLGGYGNAYSITHFDQITGWKRVAAAGSGQILTNKKPYKVLVRITGRNLKLEVDGVQVLECDLESDPPFGQVGLFAWGNVGGAQFSNLTVTRQPSDVEHVVVLVHGIRSQGDWQQILRTEFSRAGIVIAPTNYGNFGALRFVLPIPWLRKSASNKVWDLVRSVRLNYPKAQISFLAHSFGTYIVANLLKDQFDFKAHRLAFCGSVLKYSFPFETIRGRFTPPIVNEVSARDTWPVIAKNVTFRYGVTGTQGFNNLQVTDRWHLGFGHSQYLTETFCKNFWIPFFQNGAIVDGASTREKAPWWCRSLRVLTSKYIWIVLTLLLLAWHYS